MEAWCQLWSAEHNWIQRMKQENKINRWLRCEEKEISLHCDFGHFLLQSFVSKMSLNSLFKGKNVKSTFDGRWKIIPLQNCVVIECFRGTSRNREIKVSGSGIVGMNISCLGEVVIMIRWCGRVESLKLWLSLSRSNYWQASIGWVQIDQEQVIIYVITIYQIELHTQSR